MMMMDDLEEDGLGSDVSSEEEGTGQHGGPAYLDTITEEDTDDFSSVSSARSSPKPPLYALNNNNNHNHNHNHSLNHTWRSPNLHHHGQQNVNQHHSMIPSSIPVKTGSTKYTVETASSSNSGNNNSSTFKSQIPVRNITSASSSSSSASSASSSSASSASSSYAATRSELTLIKATAIKTTNNSSTNSTVVGHDQWQSTTATSTTTTTSTLAAAVNTTTTMTRTTTARSNRSSSSDDEIDETIVNRIAAAAFTQPDCNSSSSSSSSNSTNGSNNSIVTSPNVNKNNNNTSTGTTTAQPTLNQSQLASSSAVDDDDPATTTSSTPLNDSSSSPPTTVVEKQSSSASTNITSEEDEEYYDDDDDEDLLSDYSDNNSINYGAAAAADVPPPIKVPFNRHASQYSAANVVVVAATPSRFPHKNTVYDDGNGARRNPTDDLHVANSSNDTNNTTTTKEDDNNRQTSRSQTTNDDNDSETFRHDGELTPTSSFSAMDEFLAFSSQLTSSGGLENEGSLEGKGGLVGGGDLVEPGANDEAKPSREPLGGLKGEGGLVGGVDLVEPGANDEAKPSREPTGGLQGKGDLVEPEANDEGKLSREPLGGLEGEGGLVGEGDLVEPGANEQAKPSLEPLDGLKDEGGLVGVGDLVEPEANDETKPSREPSGGLEGPHSEIHNSGLQLQIAATSLQIMKRKLSAFPNVTEKVLDNTSRLQRQCEDEIENKNGDGLDDLLANLDDMAPIDLIDNDVSAEPASEILVSPVTQTKRSSWKPEAVVTPLALAEPLSPLSQSPPPPTVQTKPILPKDILIENEAKIIRTREDQPGKQFVDNDIETCQIESEDTLDPFHDIVAAASWEESAGVEPFSAGISLSKPFIIGTQKPSQDRTDSGRKKVVLDNKALNRQQGGPTATEENMDINLDKVFRKFTHYNEVYSDAPKTNFEEIQRGKRHASSASSSSSSSAASIPPPPLPPPQSSVIAFEETDEKVKNNQNGETSKTAVIGLSDIHQKHRIFPAAQGPSVSTEKSRDSDGKETATVGDNSSTTDREKRGALSVLFSRSANEEDKPVGRKPEPPRSGVYRPPLLSPVRPLLSATSKEGESTATFSSKNTPFTSHHGIHDDNKVKVVDFGGVGSGQQQRTVHNKKDNKQDQKQGEDGGKSLVGNSKFGGVDTSKSPSSFNKPKISSASESELSNFVAGNIKTTTTDKTMYSYSTSSKSSAMNQRPIAAESTNISLTPKRFHIPTASNTDGIGGTGARYQSTSSSNNPNPNNPFLSTSFRTAGSVVDNNRPNVVVEASTQNSQYFSSSFNHHRTVIKSTASTPTQPSTMSGSISSTGRPIARSITMPEPRPRLSKKSQEKGGDTAYQTITGKNVSNMLTYHGGSHGSLHQVMHQESQNHQPSGAAVSPSIIARTELRKTPEPERIIPPTVWKEEVPKIGPSYPTKVYHRDESPPRQRDPPMGRHHVSSEHLQKLLEDPYYKHTQPTMDNAFRSLHSYKTLNNPQQQQQQEQQQQQQQHLYLQKPHQPPTEAAGPANQLGSGELTQRNLKEWERLPENTLDSKRENLLRWRNSVNLTDNEIEAALLRHQQQEAGQKQQQTAAQNQQQQVQQQIRHPSGLISSNLQSHEPNPPAVLRSETPVSFGDISYASTGATSVADLRRYNRKLEDEKSDGLRQSRRNKYRHKIDKARADFITNAGSVSDLYKTRQEFEEKFRVSMEEVARPVEPARGPLASTHTPTFNSKIDLTCLPPMRLARPPPSTSDAEYKRLVAEAERRWAAYRHRVTPPKENLYSRNRALSTGYLETNVDTGEDTEVKTGYVRVEETDIDTVHNRSSASALHQHSTSGGGGQHQQPQQRPGQVVGHHQGRSRTREEDTSAANNRNDPHYRAKSVDYLMDRYGRAMVEPPENQLQKILGQESQDDHRLISQHELRFRKSTEKLLAEVPDWYLDSEQAGSHPKTGGSTHSAVQHPENPAPASRPMTAEPNYRHPHPVQRSVTPPSYYHYQPPPPIPPRKAPETTTTAMDTNNSSSYQSPWTGGRVSSQNNSNNNNNTSGGQYNKWESPSTSRRQRDAQLEQRKRDAFLPSDFFNRYKDEVEEFRKSRESLHHLASSASAVPAVPQAQQQHLPPQHHNYGTPAPPPLPPKTAANYSATTTTSQQPHHVQSHLPFSYHSSQQPQQQIRRPMVEQQEMGGGGKNINHTAPAAVPVATVMPQRPQPQQPQQSATNNNNNTSNNNNYSLNSSFLSQQTTTTLPTNERELLLSGNVTGGSPSRSPRVHHPIRYETTVTRTSTNTESKNRQTEFDVVTQQQRYDDTSRTDDMSTPSYIASSTPKPTHPTTLTAGDHLQQTYTIQERIQEPPPIQQPQQQQQQQQHRPVTPQHFAGGWSVSHVPPEWNQPKNRNSRVIEVTDNFDRRRGPDGVRLAGHLTLEEILDGILNLPSRTGRRLSVLDESSGSLPGFEDQHNSPPKVLPHTPESSVGPFIFTQNHLIMDRCMKNPHVAQDLLQNEDLWVQCAYSGKVRPIGEARKRYVSCKYCYTYYASRDYRFSDWMNHKDACNFARINTICKEVILKVKEDPEAQWEMSQVAREGNNSRGRGAVNFRFRNPFSAQDYVSDGWPALNRHPGNHLYYYTVPNLVEAKKDPSLIALCRRYDPSNKFILSVSVIAELDECPETPIQTRSISNRTPIYATNTSNRPTPIVRTTSMTPQQMNQQQQQHQQQRPLMDSYQTQQQQPYPNNYYNNGDQQQQHQQQQHQQQQQQQQQHQHQPPPSQQFAPRTRGSLNESKQQSPVRQENEPSFTRTQSLPHRVRKTRIEPVDSSTGSVLKSVLRSMENIAPGIPEELNGRITPDPISYGRRTATPQQYDDGTDV